MTPPLDKVTPRSSRRLRIWLITAVLRMTQRSRTAVHGLQIQLLLGFNRHKSHRRPLDGFGHGLRIDVIALVRLYVRLHILSRHQSSVVALFPQSPSQEIRLRRCVRGSPLRAICRELSRVSLPAALTKHYVRVLDTIDGA